MAKSSLSLESVSTPSDLIEGDYKDTLGRPVLKRSLPWVMLGCISLPIKLPFPTPFECKTPRQTPTLRRQPQPRKTVLVSQPVTVSEPVQESPEPIVPSASTPPRNAVAQGQLSQLIHQEINDIRQSYGLNSLRWNANLANVARQHSQNMADRNFFSHADPWGDTALERVRAAGIRFNLVAENLALNENAPDPASLAIEGWLDSPGHRRNILRAEVTETGVGVVRQGEEYFFTQLFIRQP